MKGEKKSGRKEERSLPGMEFNFASLEDTEQFGLKEDAQEVGVTMLESADGPSLWVSGSFQVSDAACPQPLAAVEALLPPLPSVASRTQCLHVVLRETENCFPVAATSFCSFSPVAGFFD